MKFKLVGALGALFLAATFPAHAVPHGTPAPAWVIPFAAIGGSAYVSLAQRMGWSLTPQDFGAMGDALSFADGAVAAGSSAFGSAAATFSASDVGKTIAIYGAGGAGAPLVTTISSFTDAHDVVLAASAVTTVSGATYTYGADDSAAFAAAINAANSSAAAGKPFCLSLPQGDYFINGTPLPAFQQNTGGGLCGAGAWKTIVTLGPSYAGDLFSWSDSWAAGVSNASGTQVIAATKYGVRVRGLTIIGNNAAPAPQNAFMFYDHDDFVSMDDIDIDNLNGRGIDAGAMKNDTAAYLRESHFSNVRLSNSGNATSPSFEITSQCSASCAGQDASNTIDIHDIDIYGSRGAGFVLRNAMPTGGGTERGIHIARLRVEGTENNPYGVAADLVQVGDAAMAGAIAGIECLDCYLISPYTNYWAVDIEGQSAAATNGVYFAGNVTAGAGGGGAVKIGAGKNIDIEAVEGLSSVATNVTVASSATVASPIIINGNGAEPFWTYAIDATTAGIITNGHGVQGVGSASPYVSAWIANGASYIEGNAHGANSVDWSVARTVLTQVASGLGSVIGGGQQNTASGQYSIVPGGQQNTAAGYAAFALGTANSVTGTGGGAIGYVNNSSGPYSLALGLEANDRGRAGNKCFSGGQLNVSGDAQECVIVLRASGSGSAFRLTSDGAVASAFNCVNMPASGAFNLRVDVVAIDHTTPANSISWSSWNGLMQKGSGSAVVSMASTPTPLSTGTTTGAALGATADATYNCLNLSFTPPTGTDTWDAVARVQTVEVQ